MSVFMTGSESTVSSAGRKVAHPPGLIGSTLSVMNKQMMAGV